MQATMNAAPAKPCALRSSAGTGGKNTVRRADPAVKRRAQRGLAQCRGNSAEQASGHTSGDLHLSTSRRNILLVAPFVGMSAFQQPLPALADDFETFYGEANPFAKPYSMLQPLGGTTKEKARYSFTYPASWTEQAVGKIEKDSNGTDCMFNSTPRLKEKLYVNSLQINDISSKDFSEDMFDTVLAKFSRIDQEIKDALEEGSVTQKVISERNGSKWYDIEVAGPQSYLMAVTSRQDRVIALFITAPPRNFNKDKEMLNLVRESFTTYDV